MQHEALTITVEEAAQMVGISRGVAYKLAKEDGAILGVPVHRVSPKRLVISRKAFLERLEGR